MKRKIFYGALCIFLAFLVILLFYICFTPTNETTLKIGYQAISVNHAPIILANDAGIFDKHKLKVELVPLKSGKEIQQALAMGRIDIGSTGIVNFFIPISKGAPVKIIAPLTESPIRIFVRPDSGINIFNDLIGKTIACRKGTSVYLIFGYALKKENVDINKLNFVDIDETLRPIALMEKKIVDVVVVGDLAEEKIYLDYGAIVFEEWKTKGYANKSFSGKAIAVNSNFMNKNKKTVDRFIDAFIESQKFIKDKPDEAARIIAKHIEKESEGAIKFSTEDVKKSWEEAKYVLWCDPSVFVEFSKLANEMGDIESALSLDQIFDLSFEEKLKNAQNETYPTD